MYVLYVCMYDLHVMVVRYVVYVCVLRMYIGYEGNVLYVLYVCMYVCTLCMSVKYFV